MAPGLDCKKNKGFFIYIDGYLLYMNIALTKNQLIKIIKEEVSYDELYNHAKDIEIEVKSTMHFGAVITFKIPSARPNQNADSRTPIQRRKWTPITVNLDVPFKKNGMFGEWECFDDVSIWSDDVEMTSEEKNNIYKQLKPALIVGKPEGLITFIMFMNHDESKFEEKRTAHKLYRVLQSVLPIDKTEMNEMDFKKAAAIGAMALGTLGSPNPALAAKHHDKGKHPIHKTVQHKNIVKDAISSGKFGGHKDNYRGNWAWTTTYKDNEVSEDLLVRWDMKNQKVQIEALWTMYQVFEDFLKLKHMKHTDEGGGEAIYSWLYLPNTIETVNFIGEFLKYAKSQKRVSGIVKIV